jgi:hypothetical protein
MISFVYPSCEGEPHTFAPVYCRGYRLPEPFMRSGRRIADMWKAEPHGEGTVPKQPALTRIGTWRYLYYIVGYIYLTQNDLNSDVLERTDISPKRRWVWNERKARRPSMY